MKTQYKTTKLVVAVAAAFALSAPAAFANNYPWENGNSQHHHHHHGDHHNNGDHHNGDQQKADPGAHLSSTITVNKDINIKVNGNFDPKSDTEALVNDSQSTSGNTVANVNHRNDASASGSALQGAQGNIGLNVGAGDNNIQSNEAALAATDASRVFGVATAQVFQAQSATGNTTGNLPAANTASLSGNALYGAVGNIGANMAAGDSNAQKNVLSASAADSSVAIASINNGQSTAGNTTANSGTTTTTTTYDPVHLHVNLDGSWGIGCLEIGNVQLSGYASGNVPVTTTQVVWSQNNASISGNALMNAGGNIGANVAAGTNNLQSNILAVAANPTSN